MEIIKPNPLLIEYWTTANEINCNSDGTNQKFIDSGEWHYIPYNLEKNIFLLKRLESSGLLPNVVHICDCGVGLATTLFDIYLQSKEIKNKKFSFTGIEKWEPYITFLKKNLIEYWNDELTLIHDDIMNQSYEKWNFIWFYQPFKVSDKAMNFYSKVITEVRPGTLIFGLDTFNMMSYGHQIPGLIDSFLKLKMHKLDDTILFQKV